MNDEAVAPEQSTEDTDFNSSLVGLEDEKPDVPAEGEEPSEDLDFLKEGEEKNPEAKEEEKTEEAKEEDYTWSPPEEMKGLWESAGEEGKKEFEAFQSYAKEKGIKGEVFKELMDKYVKNVPSPQKTTEALAKEWGETLAGWHKEILGDKEIGGQKYKQSKENAILAVKELGGKALADELVQTGFGNNPKLFKALVKAGEMMREGSFIRGGSPKEPSKIYDNMYPTMK